MAKYRIIDKAKRAAKKKRRKDLKADRQGYVVQRKTTESEREIEPYVNYTRAVGDTKGNTTVTELQKTARQSDVDVEELKKKKAIADMKDVLSGEKRKENVTDTELRGRKTAFVRGKKNIGKMLKSSKTGGEVGDKVSRENQQYDRYTRKFYKRGKNKGSVKSYKQETFFLDDDGKVKKEIAGEKYKFKRGDMSRSNLEQASRKQSQMKKTKGKSRTSAS